MRTIISRFLKDIEKDVVASFAQLWWEKRSNLYKSSVIMIFLILFCSTNSAKAETPEIQFPEIIGWSLADTIYYYDSSTLFEYINGAAESFLVYNFLDVTVGEYESEEDGLLVIDIYRQQSPEDAFGIYSQERPREGNFIDIGNQGYWDPHSLNLWISKYYIKIYSYSNFGDPEKFFSSIAINLIEKLGCEKAELQTLSFLPRNQRIENSEQYIAKNFLGYDFLHSGYIAEYQVRNENFRLFIIEGDSEEDSKNMKGRYCRSIEKCLGMEEGWRIGEDPHHGPVTILNDTGKYVIGIIGLKKSSNIREYLCRTAENAGVLKKRS